MSVNLEEQESSQLENLFSKIAKLITSSMETDRILRSIMHLIETYFHPENWSLFGFDETTQELSFIFAKGLDHEKIKHVRLRLDEGVVGHVAQTKKSLLILDANNHPLFSNKVDVASGFKTNSIIAVPIVFQNNLLGIIELINTLDNMPFTKRKLAILETIADFAAISLTNAKAYERANFLALHDPLTKLYNRTGLENILQERERKCSEDESQHNDYALAAWIDLDGFKEVNDTLGHSAGDEVLCVVATLLQSMSKKTDYVFRVGGDEFLLIRLDVHAQDLQREIEDLNLQLQLGKNAVYPARGYSFGISSGLEKDLRKIISNSDSLMYEDKRKNHTVTS